VRIKPVTDSHAGPAALAAFDRARRRYGWVPNTVRVMARGSAAAELYLTAGEVNSGGTLSAVERELVAVLVAARNGCTYCRTAHALAAAALGVGPDGIAGAGTATSTDERTAVVLTFAATVLAQAGRLSDADVARARDEGLDDAAMLDIVAVIAENVLGNLVNNLAATTLDPMLQRAARGLPDAGSEAGEARPPIS